MKRLSWPGIILVAGSTIVSWLTTSPGVAPPGRTSGRAAAIERGPGETASASIAAMQLHDWNRAARDVGRADRNIFTFKRPGPKAVPEPAPATGLLAAGREGRQPALALFKLIGVAEDAGSRTAIISGQGQLYLVKEGETVAFIYRVGRLSPESVELEDSTGGPPLRLFLK